MKGKMNDNADAHIGDETQSLAGKESFSASGFNDSPSLGDMGKQVVDGTDAAKNMMNDDAIEIDGGHISG